jgi:hypothetical protein
MTWHTCDMAMYPPWAPGAPTRGHPSKFAAFADLVFTAPDFGCVQWEAHADG